MSSDKPERPCVSQTPEDTEFASLDDASLLTLYGSSPDQLRRIDQSVQAAASETRDRVGIGLALKVLYESENPASFVDRSFFARIKGEVPLLENEELVDRKLIFRPVHCGKDKVVLVRTEDDDFFRLDAEAMETISFL